MRTQPTLPSSSKKGRLSARLGTRPTQTRACAMARRPRWRSDAPSGSQTHPSRSPVRPIGPPGQRLHQMPEIKRLDCFPVALDFQLQRLVEHRQVTYAPERMVVDGHYLLAAALQRRRRRRRGSGSSESTSHVAPPRASRRHPSRRHPAQPPGNGIQSSLATAGLGLLSRQLQIQLVGRAPSPLRWEKNQKKSPRSWRGLPDQVISS